MMSPVKQQKNLTPLQTTVLVGQLISILIALGLYVSSLGEKNAVLTRIAEDTKELRVTATELTKAVIRGQAIDEKHTEAIAALALKIDRMNLK
ncbi:MAG: hypothetical protein F2762_03040 [Actinobacteria bacterium]|nr:hypothetical protein [Actinomycetota bacterium]